MARLATIDDSERRKYEEYNRRTYGTNLDAASNSRRQRNNDRTTATTTQTRDTRSQARPAAATTNSNVRPPTYRQPRQPSPNYRPRRQDRRITVKVPGKKHVAFAVRWLVRLISLGLFLPQALFGLLTLTFLGGASALGSGLISSVITSLFGGVLEAAIMLPWVIMIAIGWIKIVLILTILKVSGAKPLFGSQAGMKTGLFIGALTLYAIPGANLIPWCFVWAEFVIHNPD